MSFNNMIVSLNIIEAFQHRFKWENLFNNFMVFIHWICITPKLLEFVIWRNYSESLFKEASIEISDGEILQTKVWSIIME